MNLKLGDQTVVLILTIPNFEMSDLHLCNVKKLL